MLKLGRAQGVAMAAALQREVPVTEYAPLKIKKSIPDASIIIKLSILNDSKINNVNTFRCLYSKTNTIIRILVYGYSIVIFIIIQ